MHDLLHFRVCNIFGAVGVGKTALALAVGHALRQRFYFAHGVFVVALDAACCRSAPALLRRIGEALMLTDRVRGGGPRERRGEKTSTRETQRPL